MTVAQILGTAAMLAGFHVRGLDQIGLSQKAGPVVSDLRLSREAASHTNRLGERQADLLLAFDQLVAASELGLAACDLEQTVAVGSTSPTPTGAMITRPDIAMPTPDALAETIRQQTTEHHFWADAQATTEDLLGSSTAANIFVVGMAVQAGALPIEPEYVEEAIGLNGVAVEANMAAFQIRTPADRRPHNRSNMHAEIPSSTGLISACRRSTPNSIRLALRTPGGRTWPCWPASSKLGVHERTPSDGSTSLDRVRRAEWAIDTTSDRLVDAVADGLFKLTAYKDEYEVARLMLDADGLAEAHEAVTEGGSLSYRLHPPMLRALGMDNKISVPAGASGALGALAKGKRLRGTLADPFRWAEVRKVERQLASEYVATIDAALASLHTGNFDTVVELAETPDIVRGYEDIKLANVELYRTRVKELLAQLAN